MSEPLPTAARCKRVGQKKTVAGHQRQKAREAFAIHDGKPARAGELARFPELQAAGAAFVKTVSVEILERIERGRVPADRTSILRAERDGDRDFWQVAEFTLV